ncbi:MAG: NAD(P)/FAD-dependent oxidoreductase [Thermoguttaceae bacterium]
MSSEHCEVLIIGAGLAGLTTAIGLSDSSLTGSPPSSVFVLEKNDLAGKKLLISGSGQCNITHSGEIQEFLNKYGTVEKSRFVKPALFAFSNQHLLDFFHQKGLRLIEEEGGKIFPETRKSWDILNLLLDRCSAEGVVLQTNQKVCAVEKTTTGFEVKTETDVFWASHLVLSCGGASYPQIGCTGDGYHWVSRLGHTIVPIRPGLTPLTVKPYCFADCSGIAIRGVGIAISESDNSRNSGNNGRGKTKRCQRFGDVLLTHKGLSGPGILDFSRFCEKGTRLELNWLGKMSSEHCESQLGELLHKNGQRTLKNVLQQLGREFGLPERFVIALLQSGSIDPDTKAAYVNQTTRRKIVSLLTATTVEVESLGHFSVAMVTCGGISLKEVNRNTLESRIVPHLYFCGEILDVDGDTGGYNLQFAFSSGMLVAQTIRTKRALLSPGTETG